MDETWEPSEGPGSADDRHRFRPATERGRRSTPYMVFDEAQEIPDDPAGTGASMIADGSAAICPVHGTVATRRVGRGYWCEKCGEEILPQIVVTPPKTVEPVRVFNPAASDTLSAIKAGAQQLAHARHLARSAS